MIKELISYPLVILAGGKSSRMHTDKSLLKFGNENSLIEFGIDKFKDYFDDIYISSKNEKINYPYFLLDKFPDFTPLSGIISSLQELKQGAFFISVDTPFVGVDVFYKMSKLINSKTKVIISKSENKIHPVCGYYAISSLSVLENSFFSKKYKMQLVLKDLDAIFIENDNDCFFNINNKDDYIKALKKINI